MSLDDHFYDTDNYDFMQAAMVLAAEITCIKILCEHKGLFTRPEFDRMLARVETEMDQSAHVDSDDMDDGDMDG